MLKLIVIKELKNIIQSPKFTATFTTLSVLLLLSFYIGINEYKYSLEQYNTATLLANDRVKDTRSWMGVSYSTYREPKPLQYLVGGINNDIGRYSTIVHSDEVKLRNSAYSDDPLFALFRNIDFSSIAMIVFSLFAILFSYNAINGEKEEGTLKLIFSNSVPRAKYIIGKIVGSWLGLVVPLLIPILLGLLLLLINNIYLNGTEWLSLVSLIFISIVYLTFFIALGTLVSSVTKSSVASFMILLVLWIVTVFIIPRVGVMSAAQMVEVPTISQIESQQDAYSKDRWQIYMDELSDKWEKRRAAMAGMTDEEKEAYEDDMSYAWMEEDDKARKQVEKDIADYNQKLNEDYVKRKIVLEQLALNFSRISPASLFQLAAMNLATSDIELKHRYEESMREYKNRFMDFAEKKQEESGESGMFTIKMSSDGGFKLNDGRQEGGLDVSELPKYVSPKQNYASLLNSIILDSVLLIIYSVICFGIAFAAFLRFDVR